jgi:hypothetical protein
MSGMAKPENLPYWKNNQYQPIKCFAHSSEFDRLV